MSETIIRVDNLSKRYKIGASRYRHDTLRDQLTEGIKDIFRCNKRARKDLVWVLNNVSFKVKQGELLGIIGRNGSGKSTLLKILSRITAPTEGRFRIAGRVSSLLEVGTGFHPELTGRENIFLNGAILGMRRREIKRKFDDIVAFAETGKFIDTPVKRYSSGMYVRLAFAVAAHLEPDILLVDEVLAVGDAAFQKKCLGKMSDVAKEGRTVLFVSHNMVAVNSLCRRAIWLDGGAMIKDGPSMQVVTDYLARSIKVGAIPEEAWDDAASAPGNDIVRLRRIRVLPVSGTLSDPLTMKTPFMAEVEYWNMVEGARLHITLHLYTDQGLVAFSTGSFDSAWSDCPLPAGLFRSLCHFPPDLLNSGQHRFTVLVVKDTSSVVFTYESKVSFNILDVRERQGAYYGKEPGVVQPVLKWTTEYIDDVKQFQLPAPVTGPVNGAIHSSVRVNP